MRYISFQKENGLLPMPKGKSTNTLHKRTIWPPWVSQTVEIVRILWFLNFLFLAFFHKLHEFPIAAVTNDTKFSGLGYTFILVQFLHSSGGQKSKMASKACIPLSYSREESFSSPFLASRG